MSAELTKRVTLDGLGEFGLIERLVAQLNAKSIPGVVGVGDDCAVIEPECEFGTADHWTVVTVDTMVEDRHFCRGWSSARDVGIKLVSSTLSDIAAMGSVPKYGVISLSLPKELDLEWAEQLYLGIRAAADSAGFLLLGGDTTGSAKISLSLTAIGISAYAPVLRSSAAVGNDIWVSGEIGLAQCGLRLLRGDVNASKVPDQGTRATGAHRRPQAQLLLGKTLGESGIASAMIDLSDGLIQDCLHVLKASGVSAELHLPGIPIAAEVGQCSMSPAEALVSGDDYQLLFTASAKDCDELLELSARPGFPRLSKIGVVTKAEDKLCPQLLVDDGHHLLEVQRYLQNHHIDSLGYLHF